MPKGKRKGKSDRGRNEGSAQTSDDDSLNDNVSVFSSYSENQSLEDGANNDEVDELAQQEAFEEKLCAALDGVTQKSAQGRTNCFEEVSRALVKKYIPDFIYDKRLTICDGIERGLKKGRSAEQGAAAQLAPLLCLQLGAGDASEEIYQTLKPTLLTAINDNCVAPLARAKCCSSMALLGFLASNEMGEVLNLMRQFEATFSGSYLKGDGAVPNVSADLAALHASALNAWALLFTLVAPGDVYSMITGTGNFTPSLAHLSELLKSPHLDVRLSAGEALALVFELGREYQEDFYEEIIPSLVETLRQLATDSHKYRAKKDRKQQRATFRDILNYIENYTFSEVQVKFGQEVLLLDSWARRKQYDALCHVLGPSINIHLTENELLRDIFQLGDRIFLHDGLVMPKQTKLERHLINAAAFKARTISRSKNRDKRSDF